jgi:hypothetical protein
MNGLTDCEKELAITAGGPAAAFSIALAELNMYWDNHPEGRPAIGHAPVINIRIPDQGDKDQHIAAVAAVARWLGVPVECRNGCYTAQRRFGTGEAYITVEAHFTPDPLRAPAGRPEVQDDRKARVRSRMADINAAVTSGTGAAA